MIGTGGTYWNVGNGLFNSTSTYNMVSFNDQSYFWSTYEESGSTTLRLHVSTFLDADIRFSATYPVPVENVVVRASGSVVKSAWVVPGATPMLYVMRNDGISQVPVARPAPGAARVVDLQVLPTGVSFATAVSPTGWIHYYANFSNGGIRWTRSFPAGTILKVDPSGHTYAVIPSQSGLTIRRFDFNGNHEGDYQLPASFGDQILSADTDRNHYLFMLTTAKSNGRRVAQVVRVNPSLTARSQPLEGFLATGIPGNLQCDAWGQVYAVTTTTAAGIQSERTFALDSRSMIPLWDEVRTLQPGERARNMLTTTGMGLVMWGNQPIQEQMRGMVRTYAETRFRSTDIGGATLTNGGGEGSVTISAYGSLDRDRVFRLTSYHPDLTLPQTVVLPAGRSSTAVPINISQGSTRRNIKVDVEDIETRQRRSASIALQPFTEPQLMSATFVPNSVTGGNQANLRVWLASDGKGWTVANLTATGGEISIPSNVTLPKGNMAEVQFDTAPVAARVVRRVDVRIGNVTKSDFLTINP